MTEKSRGVKDRAYRAKMKAGKGLKQEEKEYLSLKEVSAMSGLSYGAVKRDIDHGNLSAYHIGRKYFVDREAAALYSQAHPGKGHIEGYTIRQIMEKIPLSYAFLIDLVKSKKLPAVKVGRQYIVPYEAFDAFLAENKTKQ